MPSPATAEDIARLEQQIGELQRSLSILLSNHSQDEILTFSEAAQLLKVTPRTLQRWVASRSIPHFRPSGKPKGDIRFYRSDVLNLAQAIKENKRPGRKPRKVRVI